MNVKKYFSVLLFLLSMYGGTVYSYDSNQLSQLYEKSHNPVLDIEKTYDISSDTIYHHDFALVLDSGRIVFFKPIQIGSDSTVFGAYFQGDGKFLFEPSVQMERDQLNRFFQTDSLYRKITEAVLFFAPQIYDSLQKRITLSKQKISEKKLKKVMKLHHRINEDTDFLYTFELLRNLISPFGKPYLMLCMNNQRDDEYMYMFNSYLREEVRFWKYFWEPGSSFMEQINSYSQYNKDETYTNINGRNKEQLDILHYNLQSAINRKGVLTSKALVQANVLS